MNPQEFASMLGKTFPLCDSKKSTTSGSRKIEITGSSLRTIDKERAMKGIEVMRSRFPKDTAILKGLESDQSTGPYGRDVYFVTLVSNEWEVADPIPSAEIDNWFW